MLDLYRASAGSGKTYTLAKKYLWYFLTITSEDGKTRLRTDAELADSARHILAVTFTNKATNEMQMRIVRRLFDLAYLPVKTKSGNNNRTSIYAPEYMRDFVEELDITPDRVAEVSRKGLSLLLENYSDFNVSTIDSFFQQVLRTFAYESEINDSYQVELDSDYLSQTGVDETLEEIDNNKSDSNTRFWLKTIMDKSGGRYWNIFNRAMSEYRTDNPYKTFVRSVGRMETEQYKTVRKEIESYFDKYNENGQFIQLYKDLSLKYEEPVKTAFSQLQLGFRELYDILPESLLSQSTRSILGSLLNLCNKILTDNLKWNKFPSAGWTSKADPELLEHKSFKLWFKQNPEYETEITSTFKKACNAFQEWHKLVIAPEFLNWSLYSVNLPYFALFGIVSRKRREYLAESNAIELAETSMILKEVINGSDTPFVYERLGTILNHFLIDEFQDTSRMQWINLKPLLGDSLSRGNNNLIIGDAKQSIYRFRNADPSLITSVVPEDYENYVQLRGESGPENTNYRSDLNIVRFNNSVFEYIADSIDSEFENDEESGHRYSFRKLYSNVVQTPNKKDETGYIEIHAANSSDENCSPVVLHEIPLLINNLLRRGYQQKEIAILVNKKNEGSEIINSIIDYNLKRSSEDVEIRFVSEQSLKLSSSRAVNIIVSVLFNLANGSNPKVNEGIERRYKGIANLHDILANFKFFQMQHPDIPVPQLLDAYFAGANDFNVLSDLLQHMQSLAIPALVEAVTATFLNEELRRNDSIYIAAFQDVVLEYCEGHNTDIGSFLKWWDRKGKDASVSSPGDTDAVQIVTIHKSKGLQYECAIVPYANWDMRDVIPPDSKKEWIWVKPQLISHPSLEMPPYIPIETSNEMALSTYSDLLNEYFDKSKMDRLNAAYVAFTRAKKELYIFCQVSGAPKILNENSENRKSRDVNSSLFGSRMYKFLCEKKDSSEIPDILRLNSEILEIDEEHGLIRVGKPLETESLNREPAFDLTGIETYNSTKSPGFLKYADDALPSVITDADMEDIEDEDLDPRSEGNIKHAVLELVRTSSDLPSAVKHLCITGVIPSGMAQNIEKTLKMALESRQEVKKWFDGTARVINERPVLRGGFMTRRPDRLLVYPNGEAVVIDYKFGKIKNSHKKQIGEYIRRLSETGRYVSVVGYLWYVNENQIIRVD